VSLHDANCLGETYLAIFIMVERLGNRIKIVS